MLLHRCVPQLSRIVKLYSFLLGFGAWRPGPVLRLHQSLEQQHPAPRRQWRVQHQQPHHAGLRRAVVVFKDYGNKDERQPSGALVFQHRRRHLSQAGRLEDQTVPAPHHFHRHPASRYRRRWFRKGTVDFRSPTTSVVRCGQGLFFSARGGRPHRQDRRTTPPPTRRAAPSTGLGASGSQAGGFSIRWRHGWCLPARGALPPRCLFRAVQWTSLPWWPTRPIRSPAAALPSAVSPPPPWAPNNVLMYGTDGTDPASRLQRSLPRHGGWQWHTHRNW